jgi:hypothetical protein
MLGIQALSRALLSDGPTTDTLCAGRRLTASGTAASPSILPAPAWCTANGCAASGGERMRASTCGPPAEYPLPKVFSKLGISSRRQLRHYLALAQPGRRTA